MQKYNTISRDHFFIKGVQEKQGFHLRQAFNYSKVCVCVLYLI